MSSGLPQLTFAQLNWCIGQDYERSLAEYEKMTDQVVATDGLLREWIFEKNKAEEKKPKP